MLSLAAADWGAAEWCFDQFARSAMPETTLEKDTVVVANLGAQALWHGEPSATFHSWGRRVGVVERGIERH